MQIPLWLPWTVVLAAALFAFLAPGEARAIPDLGRRAVLVVAFAVALCVSVDRYAVSEAELSDAVEHAAALSDGMAGVVTNSRIGALVEERLGREVTFDEVTTDSESDVQRSSIEVRIADGDDGPVACLDVQTVATEAGPAYSYLNVNRGPCDD